MTKTNNNNFSMEANWAVNEMTSEEITRWNIALDIFAAKGEINLSIGRKWITRFLELGLIEAIRNPYTNVGTDRFELTWLGEQTEPLAGCAAEKAVDEMLGFLVA